DMEEVALSVERAIANVRIKQKISYYHDRDAVKSDVDALVCNSQRMKEIAQYLEKITGMRLPATSDYPPVLILGETGTGKDLIARMIHYRSCFSSEALIEVNCSTLPKGLEEAELFGFEKGSFTGAQRSKRGLFEAAQGGAIFLNEIGDLTAEAQVKLLQVIERKTLRRIGGLRDIPLDVRVIAATNRDLKNSDHFREDLYFRLHNLTIETAPLRERKEDILDLANLFLQHYGRKYAVEKKLSGAAQNALLNYRWPGNVRELRQMIERATFLSSSKLVTDTDLNLPASNPVDAEVSVDGNIRISLPDQGVDFEALERAVILKALQSCKGNVSLTARRLSMGREALRYRIKKHQISLTN
ncbi:MAG: sigma 54-interacting transcriptional regulator, partial [Candidatus Zixiibacteriota bacterium]